VWDYTNPIEDGALYLIQGDTVTVTRPPPQEIWANRLFRAPRYPPDYPGFAGRDLTPGNPLEFYDSSADLTLESTQGGTVIGEGTYPYGVGQLVTIVAEANPERRFLAWTVESGSATFSDANSAHATFTMGSRRPRSGRTSARWEFPPSRCRAGCCSQLFLIGITSLMVRRRGAWQASAGSP
jgi:hypothetical protein